MKDLLQTGAIRNPELVNSILSLPYQGKLNDEDQRKINLISNYYQQGLENGTIGFAPDAHGNYRNTPLKETIFSFLDDTGINPQAQERLLVYCGETRLRNEKEFTHLLDSTDLDYTMSSVRLKYSNRFSSFAPEWLTYLLQDAISSSYLEDSNAVLAGLCILLGCRPLKRKHP